MTDTAHPVVLFDGVCNLCNRSVQFIIDHDPAARFRFASQQSAAGQRLLLDHGIVSESGVSDSIVLIDRGRVWQSSSAVLRICSVLGGWWRPLSWLRIIPRPIRNLGYRVLARRRYQWFGTTDSCRLPTPELRSRFLDAP